MQLDVALYPAGFDVIFCDWVLTHMPCHCFFAGPSGSMPLGAKASTGPFSWSSAACL